MRSVTDFVGDFIANLAKRFGCVRVKMIVVVEFDRNMQHIVDFAFELGQSLEDMLQCRIGHVLDQFAHIVDEFHSVADRLNQAGDIANRTGATQTGAELMES